MGYSFNVKIAVNYGVEEAVFIHNLYWWIRKNEANGRHHYDGKSWTYNSMEAFVALFPFWSIKQVRRIIANLKKAGALLVGNYNQLPFDHTQWYALSDEVYEIYGQDGNAHTSKSNCPNGQNDVPERSELNCPNGQNRSAQMGRAIPDSKPYNKPDSKPPLPPKRSRSKGEQIFQGCLQMLDGSDLQGDEKEKLQQWLQYKRERKDGYAATGFQAMIAEYRHNARRYGREAVFREIDRSMASGYAGIVWDRLGRASPSAPSQRRASRPSSYDIDEMERLLLYNRPVL